MEKTQRLTVFVKPEGCFQCTKTKDILAAAGVQFVAVDITTDAQALAYVTETLGYSQAPVILYDRDGTKDHWSGLNPTKLQEVIALEGAS